MLKTVEVSCHLSLIGVMKCILEMGCVDINSEMSLQSSHQALPGEGYLEAMLHIMNNLKLKGHAHLHLIQLILTLIIAISGM